MKNKKIIVIIVGAIFIIISIIALGIIVNSVTNSNNENINNEEDTIPTIQRVGEDGLNLIMTEENLEEIATATNAAPDMRITKAICLWKAMDDEYGYPELLERERQALFCTRSENNYIAADLISIEDDPDYETSWAEKSNEIIKRHEIEMKDNFGVEISEIESGLNNYDIILKVAEFYQIDINSFINMPLDTYNSSYDNEEPQKIYYCDLADNFDYSTIGINENDYDEITDAYGQFVTDVYPAGEYLSFLDIFVFYTKDGQEYLKTMNCSVMLYGEDE